MNAIHPYDLPYSHGVPQYSDVASPDSHAFDSMFDMEQPAEHLVQGSVLPSGQLSGQVQLGTPGREHLQTSSPRKRHSPGRITKRPASERSLSAPQNAMPARVAPRNGLYPQQLYMASQSAQAAASGIDSRTPLPVLEHSAEDANDLGATLDKVIQQRVQTAIEQETKALRHEAKELRHELLYAKGQVERMTPVVMHMVAQWAPAIKGQKYNPGNLKPGKDAVRDFMEGAMQTLE